MRQYKQEQIIIDKILGTLSEIHPGDRHLDPILMPHEQLEKPHQKVVSKGGITLGISLEPGQKLYSGAVLWVDDKTVVFVELEEEDLLEVIPCGNLEWARVAFNIGNMHHPAYLYEQSIRIPYDEVIERMLHHLGVQYLRKNAKLDGLRANAPAAHGSNHAHAHGDIHKDHHEG